MADVQIQRMVGAQTLPFLDDLGRLRITVFREYPYLYAGDLAYEREYLRSFASSARSVCVLALDGAAVVGAATGLPLAEEHAEFVAPFLAAGYDPARVFYLAESVLLPAYRGRGLGHRFFDERENHARTLGGFSYASFCAVERPPDHPLRPPDYRPLDPFWIARGYVKQERLRTLFSWRDLDTPGETAKPMVFWLRALNLEPGDNSTLAAGV